MNLNVDLMEENVIQINGGRMINVDVSVKKRHVCNKDYVWNPATCNYENVKCLASKSTLDDSAITFDGIIESYDEGTDFNEKKQPVKRTVSMFYLHFY